MKMFKKLMAVALAGAMALVVLTGCASDALNKKEIIAQLTDETNGRIVYSEISADQANKVIEVIDKVYEQTEDKSGFNPLRVISARDQRTAVKEALKIDEDTKDFYEVRICKVTEKNSEYFKKHDVALMLGAGGHVDLNDDYYATSNEGTVSMNTAQYDGVTYLIMVVVHIA